MIIKIELSKSKDGRSWIRTINQVQCAACLYVQQSDKVIRKKGIVIGYEIKVEDEQHAINCVQRPEE